MYTLSESRYMIIFKKRICSACELCEPEFPAFCMSSYGGDPGRFFEIIKYINALRILDTHMVEALYTFEGFCGLFCNSQKQCPDKNLKCRKLDYVFSCYESFANQSGVIIPPGTKMSIWEAFSGVETKNIGKPYRLPTKNPLRTIDKKKRRKINKLIRTIKQGIRLDMQIYNNIQKTNVSNIKKRKKPKTTFFCNDDDEWKKKIDSCLGEK